MKNYFIKGQRFMPACFLSLFMLLSVGFTGNAQASCGGCNVFSNVLSAPVGLLDFGFLRSGSGCCPTRVVQPVCCPDRVVSRTYWTNWRPYYHYSQCGCPVRCKKSCLVSRCSGKVIRCVKRCAY